ncbi:MAG: glycosyltransferase [Verrucomicrobia bacterium]|jgi:GT2 family glycosyltransferase|nr:glycosyltransferase [Verrucomicrobiota bacterium]
MTAQGSGRLRVTVDGKFFRLGDAKFHVKGVAYGPFAPNPAGQCFLPPEQTLADFRQIRKLGANVVRVYEIPPRWMLDLAEGEGLWLLVGIPWTHQLWFLDSREERTRAMDTVRKAVAACGRHPAVFAFCLANEIAPDVVRWAGAHRVERFLDELAAAARRVDPDGLCTFANFPPTEFLRASAMDFLCFNVYLHERPAFRNYLARLQMLAENRPLVLGEFGIDSLREGETRQAEILGWSIELACRAGLAGTVVFSFTDEWHKDGVRIEDWKMGLTTADRQPRPACDRVRETFQQAPRFALAHAPKVSVVVASYNAAPTLRTCLESLERLHYPDFEVILVDDGSTDETPRLVQARADGTAAFPHLRVIRHAVNAGLSAARNTGIAAAQGEVVAFTDADCRVDEDWLYFLVSALFEDGFAAMGGPNLLPPEDSAVATAVMVSPGGPAHVMLNDREAEHIPGCNMAFFKSALEAVGGFDPVFTRAGDDVDLCWRLQQAGLRIGFSPAAFVWHYRRSSVMAYLGQQQGYGEAEALLVRKHPEYFNRFGGGLWRGRIYGTSKLGVLMRRSIIYRGTFGSGWFQTLYASEPAGTLMLCTSIEHYILVCLPLWVLSANWSGLLPLAIAALALPLTLCALAGAQATLPQDKRQWWSRPLVALLFLLQPIVRGWARYQGRFTLPARAPQAGESLDSLALLASHQSLGQVRYASDHPLDRIGFVSALIRRLDAEGWPSKSDIGWSDFDVEIYGSRWSSVQVTTALETSGGGWAVLRCRLKPRWSLPSHALFWATLALGLLAIGLRDPWWPWSLGFLATAPLIIVFVRRQQRELQSRSVALLDALARELGLKRNP